ncbi:MAG: endolytic transglycosylase MltG [bacterium]|nr:endolytic transglycosylase MltG [bacterium]
MPKTTQTKRSTAQKTKSPAAKKSSPANGAGAAQASRKSGAGGGRALAGNKLRLLGIAGAAAVLLGLGALLLVWTVVLGAPGDGERSVEFEVPSGVGAFRVARDLEDQGIISSPDGFRMYLRLTGKSQAIKVGVYELNDGMSAGQVADILTEGRVQLTGLTIPEGWTNRQIGDYLAEKGYVPDRAAFLKIASDAETLKKWGIPDRSTEGYLFPETYMVARGSSAEVIHEAMLKNFFRVLEEVAGSKEITPEIRSRIVLASMVEREAVRAEERPMMAQVFLNRLDQNMRLESCATIQYLFDRPKPRIFERDLEIESPYNTYRNPGLPPGPISNPGRAAIEAAFEPKAGDYLFFVLKPDGSHHFSRTYGEHLRAKKKFIDS